jgi:hypothetical protein
MVNPAIMKVLIHAVCRASTDNVGALSLVGGIFVPVLSESRFPAGTAAHVHKGPRSLHLSAIPPTRMVQ